MEAEHTIEQPSLPAGTRVLQAFVLGPLQESTVAWSVHLGWAARAGTNRVRVMVLREPIASPSVIAAVESHRSGIDSLLHPNLAPLVACGIEHGVLVVVEPEVVGSTLRDRLLRSSGRRLSMYETARIVHQCARGLAFLASRPEPIAHEMLDPESIYLAFPKREVRIVRPGLAHLLRASGIDTRADRKVSYAAPEQLTADGVISPAVDQFVLASIAFECLTGGPAFPSSASGAEAMLRGARPRLSPNLGPNADALTDVLHRAWSAHPGDRYPDAPQFAREFAVAAGTTASQLSAPTMRPMRRESLSRRSSPPGAPGEVRRSTRPSLRRALARKSSPPSAVADSGYVELAPWDLESVPSAEAREATATDAVPGAKPPRIAARADRKRQRRRALAKAAHRVAPTPATIAPVVADDSMRPITIPAYELVSLEPSPRRSFARLASALVATVLVFAAALAIAMQTRVDREPGRPASSVGATLAGPGASPHGATTPTPVAPPVSAPPVVIDRPADGRTLHDALQRGVDECSARFGRVGRHVHATIRYHAVTAAPIDVRVWGPPLRNDFHDCVASAARSTRAPAATNGEWEHDFRLRSF